MSQHMEINCDQEAAPLAEAPDDAHGNPVRRLLEKSRSTLVDPSRRNRLINAPLKGKRPWCLAVEGQAADDLLESLHRDEGFKGYAFATADEAGSSGGRQSDLPLALPAPTGAAPGAAATPAQNGRPILRTSLTAEKLDKRLTKIFREERTLEEEQGLSTLFLAAGFLKWFDAGQSDIAAHAPLILIPVTLKRVQGKEGYLLVGRDDDIVVNVSLREKLRVNFGILLPDIPEGDNWTASDYLAAVAEAVASHPKWEVVTDAVGLAFFAFSKLLMWRDLDPDLWPNNGLLANGLIGALLGTDVLVEGETPLVGDEDPIDERIDLARAIHVVDADSSQAVVVAEADAGRNLVVQGPPGTGKSQTITNVIAAAVHSGKRVLFVAEKVAALEVVHDRLKKVGLETLCLEMHSRKANKRDVLHSLEKSLKARGMNRADPALSARLTAVRDNLNGYTQALHRPVGESGRSPYELIGRQIRISRAGIPLPDQRLDAAADWSASKIAEVDRVLERASTAITKIGQPPVANAWFGTGVGPLSPFDQTRLQGGMQRAVERLRAFDESTRKILAAVDEQASLTFDAAASLVQSLRHVAAVPANRSVLTHPAWTQELDAISGDLATCREFLRRFAQVDRHFTKEALSYDPTEALEAIRSDDGSLLRRFSQRCRRANSDLKRLSKGEPPKDTATKIERLESLRDYRLGHEPYSKAQARLKEILGPVSQGTGTDWSGASKLVDWCRAALPRLGSARLVTFGAQGQDPLAFGRHADRVESLAADARAAIDEILPELQADTGVVFGRSDIRAIRIPDLIERLDGWLLNLDGVHDWVGIRGGLSTLRQEGMEDIAASLEKGATPADKVRPIADLLITEALWRRATRENPALQDIDGAKRSEEVSEFQDLDRKRIQIARQEVLARYLDRRPDGHAGEMAVIRAEIGKKRGHFPVRKLMDKAGEAIQRLKPVFLMSPLSVAQFLPPGKLTFDLIVIDEASQIAPEDALGAIARAKRIVVVGDHRQLPPTNFFGLVNAGDDDPEDEEEDAPTIAAPGQFESILTLARSRGFGERTLAWHYRSRHPSLIALSNRECYAEKLLLPPSPFERTGDFGLSLVKTPRGHYDRGGAACDLVQAGEIAEAIKRHIRQSGNKSLGVACFSTKQRDAIDDMIDKAGIRGEVEAFCPKGERLFVKNLESVQGDERDVIFISVGYGYGADNVRPPSNFGPVSKEGGERRLNVLASRAREKCLVFSSITAADIPADQPSRGTRMLRALLHFAETGRLSEGAAPSDGEYESPFEEAVAQVIKEAGYGVHAQVGVSSFRVDMGIFDHARPGAYILGIECDGATYHGSRSARDRDRLRQEVLEGLGWRLHRIWSTDWFRNPQRETERLLEAIRRAAESQTPMPEAPEPIEELPPQIDSPTEAAEEEDEGNEAGLMPGGSSNVEPYREAAISAPINRPLLDVPVPEMARLALAVVEAEGPVHTEEVARRIREAFGLKRSGTQIVAHVRKGLTLLGKDGSVSHDGEFWIVSGREPQAVRDRRNASAPLKKAASIAPSEYCLALSIVVDASVSIPKDDLVVQTARILGFDRTGPDLKAEIEKNLDGLLKKGDLEEDDGKFRRRQVAP
ncbi:DUF3320 domain-containing protein [Methylocystis sp. JAN1]|uniref:DUF3320 domain-containing protein n=1 Tax=Methylocystis sp. JAN1 TaxID=3397211 RepID=UPI003FA290DF